jgi:Flp pilus assembly protein TadG
MKQAIVPRRKGSLRRSGAVLVEAALVLPMVLLFFVGVMEFGRWLMTANVYNNAARAGAVYAAKHSDAIVLNGTTYGCAVTDVQNVVTGDLPGVQLGSQVINVYLSDALGNNVGAWTPAAAGQYVCVQITGTYTFMIPALLHLPATETLTFTSIQPSEGN